MIGNNVSCGKKNEGLSWDAGDRRNTSAYHDQRKICVNSAIKSMKRMSASCRLRQNELPKKLSVFLSNAVLRQVIEAKIHKLIVCF